MLTDGRRDGETDCQRTVQTWQYFMLPYRLDELNVIHDADVVTSPSANETHAQRDRLLVGRPHSIILASCKPDCKPGRRLACRKQVESMSKAGRKPAANLLQTFFKQNRCYRPWRNGNTPHGLNSISETGTDMMRIALCFQKWKPMIWVDTCSNFRMDVSEFCVP